MADVHTPVPGRPADAVAPPDGRAREARPPAGPAGDVPSGPAGERMASAPLWHRLRAPLVTAGAVGAGTAALVLRTPHVQNSYGFCPLLVFTGWACPLCGGLRGTYELAHLDVAGAWAMNPFWTLLAPLVVVLWAVWTYRRARGRPGPRLPLWTAWATLGSLIAFGVLRNVPPLEPYLTPWL